MSGLTWKRHVAIENTPNSVYNIDDFRPMKRKFKLGLPRDYEPGDTVSESNAAKIIRYITMKLDWELIEALLQDRKFVRSHLTLEHLEIIVGRGLLSGYLNQVKDMFERAKSMAKYESISVSDAFFLDLIVRKKKGLKTVDGMLLMTLIRQNNFEIIKFALENRSPDIDLQDITVMDGDMSYSVWAQQREVHELTPEEKLAEVFPKEKIFDSLFDEETVLSSFLRLQTDSTVVDPVFDLLLKHGANPIDRNHQSFKVAAMCGLHNYIEAMLKFFKESVTKTQVYKRAVRDVFITVLAHSASENQFSTMSYVRNKLDKPKKGKREKPGASRKNKQLLIGGYIEDAVARLTKIGAYDHSTSRYRILNGIYNLLKFKNLIEVDEARMRIEGGEASSKLFTNHEQQQVNNWERSKTSSLQANRVVNYNAAAEAFLQPTSSGLGAVLNRNFNVDYALELQNLPMIGEAEGDGAGSIRSSKSYSTSSSTISRSGRKRKKALIKPNEMFKWLLCLLQKNDYNGENMALVLFSLGLRPFIAKRKSKRKKSGDSQVSGWELSQAGDSVVDINDFAGNDEDLEGDDYENSDDDALDVKKAGRTSRARRRRSTLTNVAEFFQEVGTKVVGKIGTRDKISSKEKVLVLEAAADFGSVRIMNMLVALIAPELDGNLLKCCYLATIGEKLPTQQMLLDRITNEVTRAISEFPEEPVSATGSSRSLRGSKKGPSLAGYIKAFEDYKDKVEAMHQLKRQKDATKITKRTALSEDKDRPTIGKRSGRKSLYESGRRLSRRLSLGAKELVKSKFGRRESRSTKSKASSTNRSKRSGKFRKSLSRRAATSKRKNRESQKVKGILKKKEMKTGTRPKKNLRQKALEKKRNEENNKRSAQQNGSTLQEAMCEYLTGLVESACLYGSLDCADSVINNVYTEKEACYQVFIRYLREYCGGSPRRKKDAERFLNGFVRLLKKSSTEKDFGFPAVAEELIEVSYQSVSKDVVNISFVLDKLSEVNGEAFLKVTTLVHCFEQSIVVNPDWSSWPDLLRAIKKNLSPEDSQRLSEGLDKIDKKTRARLAPGVKGVLKEFRDQVSGGKLKVGKNSRSKKDRFSMTRRSISRTKSRLGSLGSFSKSFTKM